VTETTKSIRWLELAIDGAPQIMALDEVSRLLNVDRAYVLMLMDKEEIHATGRPGQREFRRDDILLYKAKRDFDRRAALRELTKLSEDAGLYDADYRSITDVA
jgi:hypothetical protein